MKYKDTDSPKIFQKFFFTLRGYFQIGGRVIGKQKTPLLGGVSIISLQESLFF